ncbi:hypothetical protein P280DRAFT_480718 [Massarina eburnea CBS 473.64]|uniref:Uncharacterized protein n=1 Tax=Massarina eburnea CBS 473.64 TaxID=1395130 RepID=A0A6A6RYS1_9PLEO|nr:hypothetical protein P280DRAFT_480718 [Massarina eburnea CBS 473.64]
MKMPLTPTQTSGTLPILPAEIWLQILEHCATDSLSHLWTTIRPLSHNHKAHVERIFKHTYIPTLALSLSLPRHDPKTNALKYPFAIPYAELNFAFDSFVVGTTDVVFASPREIATGDTMAALKEKGSLTKERLDDAMERGAWVCFGRSRAKGAAVMMPSCVCWDGQEKGWKITVDWMVLVSSLFEAKRTKAQRVFKERPARKMVADWRR